MAGKTDTQILDLPPALLEQATPAADWIVVVPLLLPLLAGAFLLMVRRQVSWQEPIAIVVSALGLLVSMALVVRVSAQGPISMTMGNWLPPFGITFTVDWLAALLVMTASAVGVCVIIYGIFDSDNNEQRYGFFPLLLLLLAGTNGAFLTGDVFNLYVWFEVVLISSFGLIVLGSRQRQLDGAVKYAFLNFLATTLFLVATGYLYGIVGTLNMADIPARVAGLDDTRPVLTIALLYCLAFGMKAAVFPVNFWLPASYHTPRAVVSAIFAGLLTKVGIYALIRTQVMLLPAALDAFQELYTLIAVITIMGGVLGALAQSEIRRLLNYLVISGIGVVMAGLAIATPDAMQGAITYMVHSMVVMTGLYLIAGIMERLTGGRSLHDIAGLYHQRPLLAGLFFILALAVAGFPPLSGFWPKVSLVNAAITADEWLIAATILLGGLLSAIAIMRVWALAFWRDASAGGDAVHRLTPMVPREAVASLLPIGAIVTLALALGIWPQGLLAFSGAAASGLFEPGAYVKSVFDVVPTL